MLNKIEFVAYQ